MRDKNESIDRWENSEEFYHSELFLIHLKDKEIHKKQKLKNKIDKQIAKLSSDDPVMNKKNKI